MALERTVARPYAKAIFEIARAEGTLQAWSELLKLWSEIVQHQEIQVLLKDPTLDLQRIAILFPPTQALENDSKRDHLLKLLAQNRRLRVLPAISEQYEVYRAQEENILQGECKTAIPVTKETQTAIESAIQKVLGKKVILEYRQDPKLLGGFLIRAGDQVIDGTLRGNLLRLRESLGR